MNNKKKWMFGAHKTSNKPVSNMGIELMLNNCYVEGEKAMYRDYDGEYDIRDLIRAIGETLSIHINSTSLEELDFMLCDWLEEDIESRRGILAMIYNLLWTKAELYESLKRYEDAEARGEIGRVPRWIPVTERLPKDDEMVLAVVDAKTDMITFVRAVEPAVWCPEEGWILDSFPEAQVERVTHWMPIPEAPEVE